MHRASFLGLILFLLIAPGLVQAQSVADPDPQRFVKEIDHFIRYDQKNSFPQKAVLFIGSSSIRLWKTHLAFPEIPVINRGFGGSHISDVLFYYEKLVKKYQPQTIVFYAGDNDIAAGKSVEQTVADFKTFVAKVKKDLPFTKIIYLPIKPSLLRWNFWPAMQKVNQAISNICAADSMLKYVDTASVLLDDSGKPDSTFFMEDGLHLNEKGYQKWNARLSPILNRLNH
ncbi:GDSL-type esterase/lipase family protein [Caldithrix abyssi]